ncbi:rhomboid family protein [Deferribacter desulfuricans SSM1]|uniref:Rhomboid family protein n=1 Tax=Deferribacter desulfuricans (strain DSM 14783 / JCM 11476 / NBRC 101012 / SSM1) TaxID=639282 RepID=D3PAV5_DEFDS|nr:rhomboid family intramembrane serine protease [Deferribacter desulfuricans]BAI79728.1 rhomboid family protein [Deferribacter desulfuricans SSM1]
MLPIKDIIPRRETPFVNYALIFINVIVFLYEVSLPPDLLNRFFYLFGLVPARYTHPEWAYFAGLHVDNYWPFFTNMFLHGSWFHLISNMWTLYIFGDNVEDRLGHFRYLIFYLLSGIAASITHFVFNADSVVPAVGASGAIAGVMGAYFVMFPFSKIITLIPIFFIPLFFEIPAVVFLGFWFFSQVVSGTFTLVANQNATGIAWWAHIGGFVFGMIFHRIFKKKDDYRDFYPDEVLMRYFR